MGTGIDTFVKLETIAGLDPEDVDPEALARNCIELAAAAGINPEQCRTQAIYIPSQADLPQLAPFRWTAIKSNPSWVQQQRRADEHSRAWIPAGRPNTTWPAAPPSSPDNPAFGSNTTNGKFGCLQQLPASTPDPLLADPGAGRRPGFVGDRAWACDEFPNAIMVAGGNTVPPQPALVWAPLRENSREGGFLGVFHGACNIPIATDPYFVAPATAQSAGAFIPPRTMWICPTIR